MSLNWNVSKIADVDRVVWRVATEDNDGKGEKAGESYMQQRTESLIWAAMVIGLGAITEKNADEWIFRLRMYEKLRGACRSRRVDGEWVDTYFTPLDVREHIGLSTNVTPITRTKFVNHMASLVEQEIKDAEYHRKHVERLNELLPDLPAVPTAPLTTNTPE